MSEPSLTVADEAEAAVLGAVLTRNDVIDEVRGIVEPDDFRLAAHSALFTAMLGLAHEGYPIDPVTLEHRMRAEGTLGLVGGLEGIGQLRTPSSYLAVQHAGLVRDASRRRQLSRMARELAEQAERSDDRIDDLLAAAGGRLDSLHSRRDEDWITLGEAARRRIEQAEREAAGERFRIPTGLRDLDEYLRGGWRPTWQVVIGAEKKVGKSILALNTFAKAAARTGHPVLFFSAEMESTEQAERALLSEADTTSADFDRGPSSDRWGRVVAAQGRIERLPIVVVDRGVTLDRLVAIARRWRRRHLKPGQALQDTKPGVILTDYVQLVDVPHERGVTREREVSRVSRTLKLLASELWCTSLAVAQLNGRKIAERKAKDSEPEVEDLRESGSIENDANLVLLLWRPHLRDTAKNAAHAHLKIGAARGVAFPWRMDCVFNGATASFGDYQ